MTWLSDHWLDILGCAGSALLVYSVMQARVLRFRVLNLAACVVLANSRLDVNKTVRQRLGTRKASFAPAEDTRSITGMEIGGVTVFGLPDDLPVWIDSRVMARERIVLGGGSRSFKVIAAPEILLKLPKAEVVDGLANETS